MLPDVICVNNYSLFVAINVGIISLGIIFAGFEKIGNRINMRVLSSSKSDVRLLKKRIHVAQKKKFLRTLGACRVFIFSITLALFCFFFIIIAQYCKLGGFFDWLFDIIIISLTFTEIFLEIAALHIFMKNGYVDDVSRGHSALKELLELPKVWDKQK